MLTRNGLDLRFAAHKAVVNWMKASFGIQASVRYQLWMLSVAKGASFDTLAEALSWPRYKVWHIFDATRNDIDHLDRISGIT